MWWLQNNWRREKNKRPHNEGIHSTIYCCPKKLTVFETVKRLTVRSLAPCSSLTRSGLPAARPSLLEHLASGRAQGGRKRKIDCSGVYRTQLWMPSILQGRQRRRVKGGGRPTLYLPLSVAGCAAPRIGLLLPWRDLIHNDAILDNPPNQILPQIYIPS